MIEVATSDHLPLFLQLNRKVYEPQGHRFRFENVWLREKECLNVVRNGWDRAVGMDIMSKIRLCAEKLQQWGGGLSKEYNVKMQQCRLKLKKFRSRRDYQGIQQYNATRWEYLCLLDKQEVYWKQRSKQLWLQEGDKNTRFFHRYASNRKKKNKLDKIMNA